MCFRVRHAGIQPGYAIAPNQAGGKNHVHKVRLLCWTMKKLVSRGDDLEITKTEAGRIERERGGIVVALLWLVIVLVTSGVAQNPNVSVGKEVRFVAPPQSEA